MKAFFLYLFKGKRATMGIKTQCGGVGGDLFIKRKHFFFYWELLANRFMWLRKKAVYIYKEI